MLVATLALPAAHAADHSRLYYVQYCAGCHALDGSGSPQSGIPDFRGQVGAYLHSPRGRAFLVQVPGSANSPLSDRDLALLLNWLLPQFSRAQMPSDAAPYTEDEVRALRAARPAAIADIRRSVFEELQRAGHRIE
jgi:cytochrome c553